MKYPWNPNIDNSGLSLPSQGAWIEIDEYEYQMLRDKSLPSQGAWIEIKRLSITIVNNLSLPSQGAWIEI